MKSQRALLLLLALALLPLPLPLAHAAGAYSVDATLRLVDVGHVTQVNTYTYDGSPTRWSLLTPPGFTFVAVRDSAGRALTASPGSNGQIEVTTQGASPYRFDVEFAGTPKPRGDFFEVDTNVASLADSPTSARLALPAGFTFAGWFSQNAATPDASNVFQWRGPQLVQMLVAQAPDAPDSRAHGARVLREGNATLTPAAAKMRLTYVYDTDVYGESWKLQLPEGATALAAGSARGSIAFQATGRQISLDAPFPFGFHLGARAFWLDLDLAAPSPLGGGYLQENFSIAAAPGDDVQLHVKLEPGLTLTASHSGFGGPSQSLDLVVQGPLAARMQVLPPVPTGQTRVTVGAYVVQAPAALAARAKATALKATELLPSAAGFAGGDRVTTPLFVVYTDADIFTYEEGYYSTGANAISIRAASLRNFTDDTAHLGPVSTLVHESTHGLLDRLAPDAPSNLSILHEGLARLAETHVEAAFPDEVITREGSTYYRHSVRPEAKTIQDRYQSGWTFPVTWGARGVTSNEERGFLYDDSGLVWHAYEEAATVSAVRETLAAIAAHDFNGSSDDAAAAFLFDAMTTHAANLSARQILYPGAQVAAATQAQFQSCMGDLAAPPYPFEARGSAPPNGCGWPRSAPISSVPAPPPQPIAAPVSALRVTELKLTSVAIAGAPLTLVAQVSNEADAAAPAELIFLVGNLERDRRTLQVPAHGTAKGDFAFFAVAAGDVNVEVRLADGGGIQATIPVKAAPDARSDASAAGAEAPGAAVAKPGSVPTRVAAPSLALVGCALVAAAVWARKKA